MQNKNVVLHEKHFVLKQKVWLAQKQVIWGRQKQVDVARKSVPCQQKKLMLRIKNISCRQNQDDAAPKKIFCAQKIFPERCAFTQSQATWIDEHSRRRGFNNNKIIKYLSKETSKNIWGKLDIKLHFGNRKVIFTVFYAK